MAKQRIWRNRIEPPPPESWPRVGVPFAKIHRGDFHRPEPEYRNINWTDNAHVWIKDQPGEYAVCFGCPDGFRDCQVYAFSDPQVAFEFRMFWG